MEKNIVASPDRPSPVALPTMILQDLLLIRARRLNGLSVESCKKSCTHYSTSKDNWRCAV